MSHSYEVDRYDESRVFSGLYSKITYIVNFTFLSLRGGVGRQHATLRHWFTVFSIAEVLIAF